MPGPAAADPDVGRRIAAYYAGKLATHGATPRGVDWNGVEGQALRFDQLARLLDGATADPTDAPPPALADLGCGYGALARHLRERGRRVRYTGYDVAPSMVEAARAFCADLDDTRFETASAPGGPFDFVVASGIFNVRMDVDPDAWSRYVMTTLDAMHAASTRGFAFNCLTSWSDADRMRADLHYADPCALFAHCKRHYARDVALLHDYGLYEFTILVRKDARPPTPPAPPAGDPRR